MANNIQAFLDPKSVAVIGASDNPNKVGGRPIHYMKKFGFKGDIYPINPVRSEIQGIKAYPDIKSIGSIPDAVIFAIGSDQILDSVKQCAELGVKAGVVMWLQRVRRRGSS
jgi:acyl-CoA synthetase (NDP forming)